MSQLSLEEENQCRKDFASVPVLLAKREAEIGHASCDMGQTNAL
jgi:hypothetical protein